MAKKPTRRAADGTSAPKRAKARRGNGHQPTAPRKQPPTSIAALRSMPLSKAAFEAVVEILELADRVMLDRLGPAGGADLRYRIELGAAFVFLALQHARNAAVANGGLPDHIEAATESILLQRADELLKLAGKE